jgi:phage terminase small subunit
MKQKCAKRNRLNENADMNLTAKQEAFCHGIAAGLSQADAYRAAYDAENMKPETVQKRACELMKRGDIAGRVADIRRPVVEKVQVDLEAHLRDLKELRDRASGDGKFGPAIQAEIARGKACGLYIERIGNPDGTPLPSAPVINLTLNK